MHPRPARTAGEPGPDGQPATVAYERTGSGPPLVLLHPLGADRRVWEPVVRIVAARRETITVDLPGFGQSPPLRGRTPTPRALAAAVADLLSSLGIRRPQLAGNSLGGWVAMELALLTPCESVTAIAPAGLWPAPLAPRPELAHRVARATLPLGTALVRTRAGRALLLGGAVADPGRVPAAQAAHLIRSYALAPGFSSVSAAMRAGRFEGLERIACPVTLVWPDGDRVVRRPSVPPELVREVVLAGSGHLPLWDAPEPLARILLYGADGLPAQP